jgi:hypothetical protein
MWYSLLCGIVIFLVDKMTFQADTISGNGNPGIIILCSRSLSNSAMKRDNLGATAFFDPYQKIHPTVSVLLR